MNRVRLQFPDWSTRLLLIVVLAFGGGAAITIFADGGSSDLGAPSTSTTLTSDELAYVNTIGVRILAMNGELQAISDLVSTHSRNVLELNRRGSRVETLAAEMDAFRKEAPVPSRFVALDIKAQSATTVALDAISQARAALSSFDFSGIADLIPSFNQAALTMDSAASSLESLVREATPIADLSLDLKGLTHAIHRDLSP